MSPAPWFRSGAGTLKRPTPASFAHLHSKTAGLSAEIAGDLFLAPTCPRRSPASVRSLPLAETCERREPYGDPPITTRGRGLDDRVNPGGVVRAPPSGLIQASPFRSPELRASDAERDGANPEEGRASIRSVARWPGHPRASLLLCVEAVAQASRTVGGCRSPNGSSDSTSPGGAGRLRGAARPVARVALATGA